MIQKILAGRKLTARCRDEIKIQRHDIINNFSKANSEQGEFYYVYNKRSDNNYGIVMHKNGETGTSISIKECQLPNGAGLDCVLRLKEDKFILDQESTKKLQYELKEMINRLLEEQEKILQEQRIEGHIYHVVEKAGDIVELIDVTYNNSECFEEIDFPSEALEVAKQGMLFKYINGKYILHLGS